MARLEVLTGDGTGAVFELDETPFLVGTSRKSDLRLREHGIAFSHAVVERQGDGYAVLAKRSTAGTWVNDAQVPANETRALSAGDTLRFGTCEARFVAEAAAPPTPTEPPPAPAAPPAADEGGGEAALLREELKLLRAELTPLRIERDQAQRLLDGAEQARAGLLASLADLRARLKEASRAGAAAQRERDALARRVAGLELELEATRGARAREGTTP